MGSFVITQPETCKLDINAGHGFKKLYINLRIASTKTWLNTTEELNQDISSSHVIRGYCRTNYALVWNTELTWIMCKSVRVFMSDVSVCRLFKLGTGIPEVFFLVMFSG